MRSIRTALAAALTASAVLAHAPAHAQDVQYETTTKVDLPGAAGTMMRLGARLGGGSTETVETTYIKGRKMRSDVGRTSTILDLEGKRFISLDHDARTYSVYTFEEMIRRAEEATAELRRDSREVGGGPEAEARLDFSFDVDRSGERQRVFGYDAEQVFLTMAAQGEAVPDGGTEAEQAGTLVVLTEMWTSKDVPAFQARNAIDDASARQFADAGAALMKGMAAAFADDPRMKVAFEQSASEARKIEGMALRTVTRFVTVAPGREFDRALATEPRAQPAQSAAKRGRAAFGRIAAGVAGAAAGRQQQGEAAESEPTQATIMTVTSEVRNVATTSLDAGLFEPPAGYREVKEGADR